MHVSTSTASRRALRRAGKRAATTGDTIHLDTERPTPEVMAHELTHVAHPSPEPRFYADDRPSPEERKAEQIAAVMRRAPILPRSSAASGSVSTARPAPAVAPPMGRAGGVVQRSPATSTTVHPPATGTMSAASLAASLTGTAAASTVQRFDDAPRPHAPPPPAPPLQSTTLSTSSTATNDDVSTASRQPKPPTTSEVLSQFDRILELLEDRIITELERRGGRFRGGF